MLLTARCFLFSLSGAITGNTGLMDILRRFAFCPVCGSHDFTPHSFKSLLCASCGFEYFVNPSTAYVALIFNDRGELLAVRRRREPARGTLDLPGGFADMDETVEEGVAREVMEETGLTVIKSEYLFSRPNRYLFSGIDIPTLDIFFHCEVADCKSAYADDDAAEIVWLSLDDIDPEQFGLQSIREGIRRIIQQFK